MSKKSKVRQFTCKCNQELNDKGFWALKKIEVLEVDPVLKELKAARNTLEEVELISEEFSSEYDLILRVKKNADKILARLDDFINDIEVK